MKNIKDMTLLDLVNKAVAFRAEKETIEAGLSVVNDELADRLRSQKVTGLKVNGWFVSRVKRMLTNGVQLSQAREYGAVKESVDSEKIKMLVAKGVKIRGIKFSEYVNIREGSEK